MKTQKGDRSYRYGAEAEQIASTYLSAQRYQLLKNRFKTPYGEIDLIMCKDKELVFVEVKARHSIKKCPIEYAFTQRQQERCYNAVEYFLGENQLYSEYNCRFDFIMILGDKVIQHLQNVDLMQYDAAKNG